MVDGRNSCYDEAARGKSRWKMKMEYSRTDISTIRCDAKSAKPAIILRSIAYIRLRDDELPQRWKNSGVPRPRERD